MGDVIVVNFKNHKTEMLTKFFSGWIPTFIEGRTDTDPSCWTTHIKFHVYETNKNFAVQFSRGTGNTKNSSPSGWSDSSPVYKKDIDKLWEYIFNCLEQLNIDKEIINKKIKDQKKYNKFS